MKKAFGLVEIIVALGLFAILATTISALLLTTLRGARKSASIGIVKNEAQTAMTAMTQMIRFAQAAACSTDRVDLTDQNGLAVVYQLTGSALMQGGVALTSPNSRISRCGGTGSVFTCNSNNSVVDVCFTADAAWATDTTTQAEGATGIRFEARVTLRNYGN